MDLKVPYSRFRTARHQLRSIAFIHAALDKRARNNRAEAIHGENAVYRQPERSAHVLFACLADRNAVIDEICENVYHG